MFIFLHLQPYGISQNLVQETEITLDVSNIKVFSTEFQIFVQLLKGGKVKIIDLS